MQSLTLVSLITDANEGADPYANAYSDNDTGYSIRSPLHPQMQAEIRLLSQTVQKLEKIQS